MVIRGLTYAAFTHNGFDDQERNLMFVKTVFQVLKVQFLAYIMKQAFYPLHKQNLERVWQQENTFIEVFLRYLVVKPACVNLALIFCWYIPS